MSILYQSTRIFFKLFDKHPYVAYRGEEVKVPISEELNGLDLISIADRNGWFLKVSDDESRIVLSNVMDGGEF